MKHTILAVSACFLAKTRYDGQQSSNSVISHFLELLKKEGVALLPFCPEQLGGLPTPRIPSEIKGNRVMNQWGDDVTEHFTKGAEQALSLLKYQNISAALLKQKSPSCGVGKIYDGNFQNQLVSGNGITAQLLTQNDFLVFTEDDVACWESFQKLSTELFLSPSIYCAMEKFLAQQ